MSLAKEILKLIKKENKHLNAHVNINKLMEQEKKEKAFQITVLIFALLALIIFCVIIIATIKLNWQMYSGTKDITNKIIFLLSPAIIFGLILSPIVRKILYFFGIAPFYVRIRNRKKLSLRTWRKIQIKRTIVYLIIGFIIALILLTIFI